MSKVNYYIGPIETVEEWVLYNKVWDRDILSSALFSPRTAQMIIKLWYPITLEPRKESKCLIQRQTD